jgi:hypothetical protein
MFQCHSYRFSAFNGLYPKLCLYFIDDFFEVTKAHTHLKYDYEAAKDNTKPDYQIRNYIKDKKTVETLFGRFGIGEIIRNSSDYTFRIKRQILFEKNRCNIDFKPNILNFWWGSNGNSRRLGKSF